MVGSTAESQGLGLEERSLIAYRESLPRDGLPGSYQAGVEDMLCLYGVLEEMYTSSPERINIRYDPEPRVAPWYSGRREHKNGFAVLCLLAAEIANGFPKSQSVTLDN